MYQSFETPRLLLKPTTLADADFILALLNTPKWLQFIGDRNVKNLSDAEAYIQSRIIAQYQRLGFGNYTLIRKEDGAKIGSCGLYSREGLAGIDLGYALLPSYEGKGYGSEAAKHLLEAAFQVFQLPVVKAITHPANTASQQLLEKLGFSSLGTTIIQEETLCLYEITNAQNL